MLLSGAYVFVFCFFFLFWRRGVWQGGADAQRARRALDQTQLCGAYRLRVKEAFSRRQLEKEAKETKNDGNGFGDDVRVHVANLPPHVFEEALHAAFVDCGEIVYCHVPRKHDEPSASRGFGFVGFVKMDDARKAVRVKNGSVLAGACLSVAWARRRVDPEPLRDASVPLFLSYFHSVS
jgi:RNA recognition motif-containing protein